MVGTRATKGGGNREDHRDHETTTSIPDPTSNLQRAATKIKTQDELNAWMLRAQSSLQQHLESCRQKAQAQAIADDIHKWTKALDEEWRTNWVAESYVQTGEIYDRDTLDSMLDAMRPGEEARSGYHSKNETTQWHTRFQAAQSYWEDFLYYQNQWNRRIRKHRSLGTAWAKLLVRLYNKWEFGARDAIPETIGADQLHRYPEGIRSSSSRPTLKREQHLREKFPRSAVRLDPESIEHRRDPVNERRRTRDGFDVESLPKSEHLLKPYSAATARQWGDLHGNEPQTL